MTRIREYDFVQCRAMGHSWTDLEIAKRPPWGFYMAMQCADCGMKRLDIIDSLGKVSSRRYIAPSGYKNPGHSDRAEYRHELIKRMLK